MPGRVQLEPLAMTARESVSVRMVLPVILSLVLASVAQVTWASTVKKSVVLITMESDASNTVSVSMRDAVIRSLDFVIVQVDTWVFPARKGVLKTNMGPTVS